MWNPATVRASQHRDHGAHSRLKSAEQLPAVFKCASALIQCNQDILDIHGLLSSEQLYDIVIHMRVDGLVQGHERWGHPTTTTLLCQPVAHLGISDAGSESLVGNGNCGDEDDAEICGIKKKGRRAFLLLLGRRGTCCGGRGGERIRGRVYWFVRWMVRARIGVKVENLVHDGAYASIHPLRSCWKVCVILLELEFGTVGRTFYRNRLPTLSASLKGGLKRMLERLHLFRISHWWRWRCTAARDIPGGSCTIRERRTSTNKLFYIHIRWTEAGL